MAHLDLQDGRWFPADRLLGKRSQRRIGHNTRLQRRGEGIAVVYHSTPIYTVTDDGWAILRTGGWHTVTTASRLNALLPGPWRIGSDRGTWRLYNRGQRVAVFEEGIAVHVGTSSGGGTDAVGFAPGWGRPGVVMSSEEVAAAVAAGEAAAARRMELRAARLLREHPEVGSPRKHRGYDNRAWDCDRCHTEAAAEREARREALRAEHPDHPRSQWDTSTRPVPCPWECPLKGVTLR